MDEPSYDVIANPISAFTTFGEAAPNPEATVEGMPAPPIDEYGPLLAQFTQLSNTLTGLYFDQQRKQDKVAGARGSASIEESAQQLLQERKGNALSIASLVDQGVLSDEENPWFYVGAKRALARLSTQAIEDQLNSNFQSDFANNEADLNSDPEPAVAMAKYLGSKTNPLNLSEDILGDYYYSSNFENSFSKIRRRATTRLIEFRNEKARNDQANAIRADVVDALRNPSTSLDLPEGAVDVDGEPIQALDHKQSVAAVISDYQNRAVFGNQRLTEIVGGYLIELAEDGDVVALDALQNSTMSNGQTLLDNDAVKAAYELAIPAIQRGMNNYSEQTRKAENRRAVDVATSEAATVLFSNPNVRPQDLAARVPGVEFDDETGELRIPQAGKDGPTFATLNVEQLRTRAFDRRYEKVYEESPGDIIQKNVNAMDISMLDGHVYAPMLDAIRRSVSLVGGGETLRDEDLPSIQQTLGLYRTVKATGDKSLMNKYFDNDSAHIMFLLDLLEKGDEGPLGAVSGGLGVSGDLRGAIATINNFDMSSDLRKADVNTFNKAFRAAAKQYDPVLVENIRLLGEIAVKMGQSVDADTLLSTHITTGDNFAFSQMYGAQLTPDDGRALFDDLIDFTVNEGSLLREGTVSRAIQEAGITNGGEFGSDEYKEWVREVKFVHSPNRLGGFTLQRQGMQLGSDLFSQDELRADLEYRTEIKKSRGFTKTTLSGAKIRFPMQGSGTDRSPDDVVIEIPSVQAPAIADPGVN